MTDGPAGPDTAALPGRPGDLAGLLAGDGGVDDLLATVLDVAVDVLPGVCGASVTLAVDPASGAFETASASSQAFRLVDEVQYSSGSGPCLQAIHTGTEVRVELPVPQWPGFSAAAGRASVRAVWSLPLAVRDRVTGALNLYSGELVAWDHPHAGAGRILARQASAFLASAVSLAESEHTNSTLRRALETRTVIGQAQGVLMARQGIDADDAFDILRRASQRTNRKLREVAAEIVAGVIHGSHRHQ